MECTCLLLWKGSWLYLIPSAHEFNKCMDAHLYRQKCLLGLHFDLRLYKAVRVLDILFLTRKTRDVHFGKGLQAHIALDALPLRLLLQRRCTTENLLKSCGVSISTGERMIRGANDCKYIRISRTKKLPPSVIPLARPVSTNQLEGLGVFTTAQPDAPVMILIVKTARTDAI